MSERRNSLPRKSSPAGVEVRLDGRRAAGPKAKHPGMYTMPGSRNPRKVGR